MAGRSPLFAACAAPGAATLGAMSSLQRLRFVGAAGGLPWPLPAVLVWVAAWAVHALAVAAAVPPGPGLLLGAAAGAALALAVRAPWRRAIAAAGFPLSALALGALPSPGWLAGLLPLALLYPLRAWRDAPFFPTPAGALAGLERLVHPAPARVLDAGCGLGHGLAALRRCWPAAALEGLEWSAPLALLARTRCRFARVRRGDMWAHSWAGFELVYVFQRPESMARAWAKAQAELAPGAWLASLEFPVPGVVASACLQAPGQRPLWLYRCGEQRPLSAPVPRPAKPRSTARPPGR